MAYEKKTWVSGVTWCSANNFNHMEDGIAEAHDLAEKSVQPPSGHSASIGITTRNSSSYPSISIDGKAIDLVPNNKSSTGNNKILDMKVDYSSSPWKLVLTVYIDGKTYTKTLKFDS